MAQWYTCWVLLAQEAAPAAQAPSGLEALLRSPLPLLLMLGVLAYLMVFRPENQRRSQHETMLGGLKKNDRVETIGGIIGTIVSVNRDQDEVVLKVDESNNTRLRVRCSAIRATGGRDKGGSKSTDAGTTPVEGNA